MGASLNSFSIADLLELRKLRRKREGIDIAKLNKGDLKKKRKKAPEDEGDYGLKAGLGQTTETVDNEYAVTCFALQIYVSD
jgi:hypothetical protein